MREPFCGPARPLKIERYLRSNLSATGRWLRGLASLPLFIGGALYLRAHFILSVILFLSGAFVLFEALRGWCALRACGIRTRF